MFILWILFNCYVVCLYNEHYINCYVVCFYYKHYINCYVVCSYYEHYINCYVVCLYYKHYISLLRAEIAKIILTFFAPHYALIWLDMPQIFQNASLSCHAPKFNLTKPSTYTNISLYVYLIYVIFSSLRRLVTISICRRKISFQRDLHTAQL
jgi:hypothetical protein